MKSSQLFQLRYLFLVLVIVFIISVGVIFIKNTNSLLEYRETESFLNSISKSISINSRLSSGSKEVIELSAPLNTEQICFVDKHSLFDEYIRNELNSYIGIDEEKNLFLMRGGKFVGYKTVNFLLSQNPLCLNVINSKISLELLSSEGKTKINGGKDINVECRRELFNGAPEDKIDIVFLPFGYNAISDFKRDIIQSIEIFKEIAPMGDNINKFNFFSIFEKSISCNIGDYIKCDNNQITQTALRCPNDYVIVLVNRNKVIDFVNQVRSSAIGNIEKINTADIDSVVMHEFGHVFGNLADEYVYPSLSGFDVNSAPNCDTEDCGKWTSIEETGCFRECTFGNFYRATKTSLMRNLRTREFGPVNAQELLRRLQNYRDD